MNCKYMSIEHTIEAMVIWNQPRPHKFSKYLFLTKWWYFIFRPIKHNPERNAIIIVMKFFSIFLTASLIVLPRSYIVSKVILVFLDHLLKPKIFFVSQPWWPTESSLFPKFLDLALLWKFAKRLCPCKFDQIYNQLTAMSTDTYDLYFKFY